MEYLLIETDEKNHIPYGINKNRAIDIRMITKEGFDRLSKWNLVEMELPMEYFFPDLLCRPFVMVSEEMIKTILIYQPENLYRGVKLWQRKSGTNASYFIPLLDELPCLSERTQYNSAGNRILKPILDKSKTGDLAVFRIKGFDKSSIVGREDFVESILRRGIRGIRMEEVESE